MSAIIFNNRRYNPNSITAGGGSVPSTGNDDQVDYFTATLNQTIFTLSLIPSNPAQVDMYVNGQSQENGKDFTVSGQTVTWLNRNFFLNNDEVEFEYDF